MVPPSVVLVNVIEAVFAELNVNKSVSVYYDDLYGEASEEEMMEKVCRID